MFKLTSCFIVALLLGSNVFAQTDAPRSFRINNIRSSGSGCPEGSVAVNVSADQQAYTLSFSEFAAEVSPMAGKTAELKNCRIVFDTEQDSGWEYSILAVNFRGYVDLDAGVRGEQKLRFGRRSKENQAVLKLDGPYNADYFNSYEVGLDKLRWSGCSNARVRDFVLEAKLLLQSDVADGRGLFTVDSIDGEMRQEYELVWRSCRNPSGKFLTTCMLPLENSNQGSNGSIYSKGFGNTSSIAQQKAMNRISNKCRNLSGQGISCNASQAVCQNTQF